LLLFVVNNATVIIIIQISESLFSISWVIDPRMVMLGHIILRSSLCGITKLFCGEWIKVYENWTQARQEAANCFCL
jgi:hypothetical protein